MMQKLRTIFDEICAGWIGSNRIVKAWLWDEKYSIRNSYDQELTIWDGMSAWWAEEYVYGDLRRIEKELKDLFGSESSPTITDSDSIIFAASGQPIGTISSSGNWDIGGRFPYSSLMTDNITNTLKITAQKSVGTWSWEGVAIESVSQPNPVRRILLELLTGAKWIPSSPKQKKKSPAYLVLVPKSK